MILLVVALAVVLLDQLTKFLIRQYLPLHQSIPVVKGVLHVTHVNNTGAAFGLMQNRQPLFLVVTALVVLVIGIYYLFGRPHSRLVDLALGLELGGALGNLIDRLTAGRVTDFLDFRVWPVFNVADTAIALGLCLLLLSMGLAYRLERRTPPEAAPEGRELDPCRGGEPYAGEEGKHVS